MKCLITGHTGTLGQQLTRLLLEDEHEVVGYSRGELLQSQLPHKNKIMQYIGDVRDGKRLIEAARGCDVIYHLAALKHVDILEECPDEAIKTNVVGTDNVLHAQRVNGIHRVVLSSTDKACYPVNSYGASKLLAERLVMRNKENIVCRWGNVLASRGSVVPIFVNSIKNDNCIRVTDKRMTRFFIKAESVAVFLYLQSQKTLGGLYIPEMRSYPVVHLGVLIGNILGAKPNIIETGIRAGEKIHEDLRTDYEGGRINSSQKDYWFTQSEITNLLTEVINSL